MRFPKGKKKALTLSYDDGVMQDQKLVKILNQYGLKGTFNLNSGLYSNQFPVTQNKILISRMSNEETIKQFKDSGHEVAIHTLSHLFLEQLPLNRVCFEVLEDRKNLEKDFEVQVRGMAYPFGTYSDQVVEILKCLGIAYCRTTISTESFKLPKDWLRMPTTCHHNNPNLMALTEKFIKDSPNNEPWLFYLWGHSYEFDVDDNWQVIETFCEKIGNQDEIWYATNIEVYDYIEQYNRIQFSLDGKMLYNPTAITLYFELNQSIYEIKSGQTIRI